MFSQHHAEQLPWSWSHKKIAYASVWNYSITKATEVIMVKNVGHPLDKAMYPQPRSDSDGQHVANSFHSQQLFATNQEAH
ncbi:MAG: hypothetical protein WBX11_01305 [Thiobacillaceae bacterium]